MPLFSFIFLRNILEGILEKEHLFGLHPYPYRSFLIVFIHFPLFYLCIFLLIVLLLAIFSSKRASPSKEELRKVASTVGNMFWIILLPPVIDFLISKGRGFELSYLIKSGNILFWLVLPFNPGQDIPGISIGMQIEIITAMILSFIWVFIKRKNIFYAFIGSYSVYLVIFFVGILPLTVAKVCGMDFAQFHSLGGMLYYDTQKFSAVLFILLFILINVVLFLNRELKKFYLLQPIEILFMLSSILGFFIGLKTFLSIKPEFFIPQDYLAIILFFLSTFLSLRITTSTKLFATLLGLISSLIISYYFFLAIIGVVILLYLRQRHNKTLGIIMLIGGLFFSFLAGLSVFTHERAFSFLVQAGDIKYELKREWNEEEVILRDIEEKIKNKKWQHLERIFSLSPYFVSPPAILYLEGIYHAASGEYLKAEKFTKGVLNLGYKKEGVYFNLGEIKFYLKNYDEAIRICAGLLESGFENLEVYKLLATAFYENGQYSNSIDFYKKAILLLPQDAALYNNLGVAYLKVKDYERAKDAFIMALKLNPEFLEAKKNLNLVEEIIHQN